MNRKDFLAKLAVTTIAINSLSQLSCKSSKDEVEEVPDSFPLPSEIRDADIDPVSAKLSAAFTRLLDWCDTNGWTKYLEGVAGITIDARETNATRFKKIDDTILSKLLKKEGFDDFAGIRLIEPGLPAMSLLYHMLASPRVQPDGFTIEQYPSPEQLDLLENYIYGIQKFKLTPDELKKDYVLAVLAYEHRPAFKTPHHVHADLVFSRTGVARIGEKPMNYDKKSRCHLNLPVVDGETTEKHVAVTPAKYGLFLAKVIKTEAKEAALMGGEAEDDDERFFLRPIRKLFNDDLLLGNQPVVFSEYHKAEKLHRLAVDKRIDLPEYLFDLDKAPFIRVSNVDHIVDMVPQGSSVLLNSVPAPLVRPAWQEPDALIRPNWSKRERLRYRVPKGAKENRYYSSFCLLYNLEDAEVYILGGEAEKDSILTSTSNKAREFVYTGPKNTPLFVNMRYIDTTNSGKYDVHMGPDMDNFEYAILTSHWAGLFEDSICDGCVAATINEKDYTGKLPVDFIKTSLPAFSLVTAPDFFPQVDSFDLLKFDLSDDQKVESNFLEGGTASLCKLRKRASPETLIPSTTKPAFPFTGNLNPNDKRSMVYDTVTAVLSNIPVTNSKITAKFIDSKLKTYTSTSFLPDASSSVFNPGWDATYSNDTDSETDTNIYLTTRGLGSPFPEDMKLCAAANGMWPVASPDIARTFQGSTSQEGLDSERYIANPTAIPLMDTELGIHENAPAFKGPNALKGTYMGWDGEQGPFIEKIGDEIHVNFTDIGRADFVANAQDGSFNMALLRNLNSAELISRMECLRISLKRIDSKQIVATTGLWLVSAEKVNWDKGAAGHGIPTDMFDNSKAWATTPRDNVKGPGYLYVFANAKRDKEGYENWVDEIERKGKRRRQVCEELYVCQVTEEAVAWCEVVRNKPTSSGKIKWRSKTQN